MAVDGEVVGEVTSGAMSPTLGENIGLALIKREYAGVGKPLQVIIRDKPVDRSALGVEGGAFFGAFFFLVGTIIYNTKPIIASRLYEDVLVLWMFGSISFTIGGLFLSVRHIFLGK